MKSKRSSARRKGDEYQDLTALRLLLEHYINGQKYHLFLEYEHVGNLDDIVIEFSDSVDAYQVKYAVNPHEVYVLDNFTNPNSKVYFKKFSDSWLTLKQRYPSKKLTSHLLTNRSLDAELAELITNEGYFLRKFIEGKQYKRSREIRQQLLTITQLSDTDFQEFLSYFQFQIMQRSLPDLIQYIQGNLLDHRLGISDRSIYYALKEIIKDFAINRRDALTRQNIDELLKGIQSKYLLPQKFEVDRTLYVEQNDLKIELDEALEHLDGDYIIVTGLPGSGKSTSLTIYLDEREKSSRDIIIRYYCFVDINDNFQKRRLEAESIRVNLLSVLQNKFHTILQRHFDYSEENFYYVLKILGEYFRKNNQKLIILIDGLDHAERMKQDIQENVIKTLPSNIPKGVIIVIGSQELHKWPLFLKKARENPITHIELPLFTLDQTQEYLINKKKLKELSNEQIQKIHQKSEGLPLYLRYIAERISETGNVTEELDFIPLISEGNIKNYYKLLWQEFESKSKGNVRHLCGVLTCLRFPVHKNELYAFQKMIDYPDFDDYFQLIQHLLKHRDNRVEIFHNSFREFIQSKLDSTWLHTIYRDITDNLKSQKGSNLWFGYVVEYAYRAKDYDYVINLVNRKFVDYALSHLRSNKDIENAIYWAIESAKDKSDILALSRLGALKSRTQERIKHNLDRSLLSKTLLAMGKEQDVIRYSYSLHQNQWLVDFGTTLNLLKELPNQNKHEVGKQFFSIFEEAFRGQKLENRVDLLNFAHCLGIYSKSLARPLKWLSQIKLQPDILETRQPYVPDYAPHLETYLNAIVRYHPDVCWKQIKKIKRLFSNQLIRYHLIRAIACHKNKNTLREEIEEYISLFRPSSNPEIAFYASLAGLPSEVVTHLLGDVLLPSLETPDHLYRNDPSLHNHRMIFSAMGYEGKRESIEQIKTHLKSKRSWWTSYLFYLLEVGQCLGIHWAQRQKDWFNLAIDSIDILTRIEPGERERIIELVEQCRDELGKSLFWLTKAVVESYPGRLNEWFEKIKSLQNSKIWTTHYGIGESIQDYTFELRIYEELSLISECRPHILEPLQICEDKFKKSTLLKGNSRSEHFLKMALIAARCGFKDKAEEWLQYGIKSTLIYGYHKDVTLFQLIDIMEMLNKYEPELALERCSDILEMVDWMPHLTDGRETKYLPQDIFEQVIKADKNAALRVLRTYARNKGRWQMQDCLETLIENIQDIQKADPEILWALTSLFANHFSEDGEHSRQIVNIKQHIVGLAEKSSDLTLLEKLKQRLDHFIKTNITPRHLSKCVSKYWQPESIISESSKGSNQANRQKTYRLAGKEVTLQGIENNMRLSFEDYKRTLEKLKDENQGFYEPRLTDVILKFHISQGLQSANLLPIKDYLMKEGKWLNANLLRELGHRFIDLGDTGNGLECLELAYANTVDWSRWKRNQNDFKIITQYDKKRALKLLVNECYRSLKEYNGYELPALIASSYDVLGDIDNSRKAYYDYLVHCQELFEQLPKREEYEWLKNYSPQADDFNQLAVHFFIDELSTAEMDLGNKLVDAGCILSLERPEVVLPIMVDRLLNSDEPTMSRLLAIIYLVTFEKPNLMLPYVEKISTLLSSKHFQRKMLIVKILKSVMQSGDVPNAVLERVKLTEQHYFKIISHSTFSLLHITPSVEFIEFFTKHVMKTIRDQIELCCKILSIDQNDILAKIENNLKQKGWAEEDESSRLKDEWDGYVHPQGYPVVWIITSFNVKITKSFNQILDEIAEKSNLTTVQIESLWRVLQPVDPGYKLSNIKPRPKDIPPLVVFDKDAWLSELNCKQGEVVREPIGQEWITLFEKKVLSQDKTYEVPYHSALLLYSSLIKKDSPFSFDVLEKNSFYILKLQRFDDNEFVTLDQARNILMNYPDRIPASEKSFLPILIWKTNPLLFLGYHEIVSLPSYLIKRYGLTFKKFDLYEGNNCVVEFGVWQDGYEDESYSRELLSYGTRLLIHKSLLEKILQDYGAELCLSIFEKRLYYKSRHEEKATEENSSTSFKIIR